MRINLRYSQIGWALGTTELELQTAIATRLRPGDVFYDIGANVGFFSLLGARTVGGAGRVVAIEPVPWHVDALRHNLAINGLANVTVLEAAAAAESGDTELLVPSESTSARLVSARTAVQSGRARRIRARMVMIDDLLREGSIPPPNVVKIDVEGAELDVLRGMTETLRAHRAVVFCEMHGNNAAFEELMRELGFEAATLDGGAVSDGAATAHTLSTPLGRVGGG
ncbi:MAG TPA: FkbM family methyltransferase [Thermoleophilaceae bacterium]|nr:FkbM family methyltransferase [Thermoleophilaceae bacterium]